MARRAHELCVAIAKDYDGDAAKIWKGATTGDELFARLRALPGYGEEKSKIFVAILAKRMGVKPKGWEEVAGPVRRSRRPARSPTSTAPTRSRRSGSGRRRRRPQGKTKQD